MSKKPLNISEEAAVQMPMKTQGSLIDRNDRCWHVGLFWYPRKTKSAFNKDRVNDKNIQI